MISIPTSKTNARSVARRLPSYWRPWVEKNPTGTIYVVWDNASMHEDDEVEEIVRAGAGRLVLLSLATYSPWLNPTEML